MKSILPIILVLIAAILSGCATPYQASGPNGGHSFQRVNNDTFSVTYKGHEGERPDRIRDFCLLRCAELTLEYNFTYFTVEKEIDESVLDRHMIHQDTTTVGKAEIKDDSVKYEERTTTTPIIISTYQPQFTYEIKCYDKAPTQGHFSKVLTADDTIFDIRYKYGMESIDPIAAK